MSDFIRHIFATRLTLILAVAAISVLGLSQIGCDEVESLDNIDVEISGQAQVAGATPLDALLGNFPGFDGFSSIDISQSQAFQNEDFTVDDVDSVFLSKMTLSVVSPEGQDLAFIDSITFFIETDGQPKKQIAQSTNIPDGTTSLDMQVVNDDIKAYVLAKEGKITVEAQGSKPDKDTVLDLTAVFDVDVNLL